MADQRDDTRAAAVSFMAEAFASLRRDHVIPTPVFHPFVQVGRDYFGPDIAALATCVSLEALIEASYPERFGEAVEPHAREFASTYVFSLLEAAVARCAVDRDFSPTASAVHDSIDEMLRLLAGASRRVVCCRVVSQVLLEDVESLTIDGIRITPETKRWGSRLERDIAAEIPGAMTAFNREPPSVFDPPHALLVVEQRTNLASPHDLAASLSQKLDRFLLQVRLLTGGTVASHYEIRGTTTLVTQMRPEVIDFQLGAMRNPVSRVARLSEKEGRAIVEIGKLLAEAEEGRARVVAASFDVALAKFQRSFRRGRALDHLVDLATALEAALGDGQDDNTALTLRLKTRAAALLGCENDEPEAIFRDVGELYSLRSKLVHGGQITERDLRKAITKLSSIPERSRAAHGIAIEHAVDRIRDLVRRAILARLCLGVGDSAPWSFNASIAVDAVLTNDAKRETWRRHWHGRLDSIGVATASQRAPIARDLLSRLGT